MGVALGPGLPSPDPCFPAEGLGFGRSTQKTRASVSFLGLLCCGWRGRLLPTFTPHGCAGGPAASQCPPTVHGGRLSLVKRGVCRGGKTRTHAENGRGAAGRRQQARGRAAALHCEQWAPPSGPCRGGQWPQFALTLAIPVCSVGHQGHLCLPQSLFPDGKEPFEDKTQ